jgi:selenocysteine lyase/cysteine desulfurase
MLIINHVSNVNGLIQDVRNIKKVFSGVPILVDGAQSIGCVDLNISEDDIDFYVFTGHKSLHGPSGTGGFYLKDINSLHPTVFGGTGNNSLDSFMPSILPDIFEAGTPNIIGIYGLFATIKQFNKFSNFDLVFDLINFFDNHPKWSVYSAINRENQSNIFSVQHKILDNSFISDKLSKEYNITVRTGLHCSPNAHKHLNTIDKGTIRFSLSNYHTKQDITFLKSIIDNF